MTDFDELRRLAQAATPSKWYRNSGLIWGDDDRVVTDTRNLSHDDAVFIAAANPVTVIALLDDRDVLRIQLRTAQDATVTFAHERDAARADLAAANARIAELELDVQDRTRERDFAREQREGLMQAVEVRDQWHADALAERDRLQTRIDKALALADEWEAEHSAEFGEPLASNCPSSKVTNLRAALAADTPTTATAEGSD
jgi:hypothetical protein